MDKTAFRILDALSRDLGRPISINELTRKIRGLHKTAHYKNIYDKIQELKKEGIIKLHNIGKSSIVTLNFNDYHTTGRLAELELEKERRFLENKTGMQMLLGDMKMCFQGFCINSISIISPGENVPLNRAEFLFIMYEPPKKIGEVPETNQEREKSMQEEMLSIHLLMQKLENAHNIKLDCLVLRGKDFLSLLKESQSNPLKVMLPNQIVFFHPQDYWIEIKVVGGIKEAEETTPAKILEKDMVYNLSRFGYKEIGPQIGQGRNICLEYIVTSILIRGDARRTEAIPVLLAKNEPRYSILLFLCKKYGKLGKLIGLLKALNRIKKSKEAGNAIKMLEKMEIREEKADEKAIKQKMRLYHAV